MPDFRTPLPIHKAAFARIAPGLAMPREGLELLRTAYQAADRSGDPKRFWRDVSDALAQHVWRWPWLEACAALMQDAGLWPLAWTQEGVPRPFEWYEVSHAARVNLMLRTLGSAVATERALASLKDAGGVPVKLTLKSGDPRCAASIDAEVKHIARVEAGDRSALPPYFPGDATDLRLSWPRRR